VFSQAYRRYVLAALTAVYTLHVVDRGLMILLLQPIKEDLQLTDTQLGFLTGIAFGLFYAVLGVPIARWADRGNRVTIASVAMGLWGLTVTGCLLVTNYFQLVIARVAAAIGEAGCKPPTYALVGDYFPQASERVRALAIYMAGGLLSNLLSFMVGGWIAERYGWRAAFFAMGIPALAMAVVFKLTIAEPRTRARSADLVQSTMPMRTVFAALWHHRSLRHLIVALILLYSMAFGLAPWYAAFLVRTHGMSMGVLGTWLGLIFGLSGLCGSLLGGYLASRWFSDNERGQMRLSAIMVAAVVPFFVAFLTLPQKYLALLALIPLVLVLSVFLGPAYALLQRLVADEMRATSMALIMLLVNLIGMGVGPQVVGILSDVLMPRFGVDSLRYAMLLVSFISLWASYHFWQVGRTVREDIEAVHMRNSAECSPA
jgi:MFS family permease